MLSELNISNFALIENLRFEVGRGFNVLTGETGAGKSIIVDAIEAALGERTSSDVVRTGADKAVVEAVFDISDSPSAARLAEEFGFEAEDNILIISREISSSGKSQCRVNGRLTTTSVLREITSSLIDIHGQHEHQSLLSPAVHIDIYDSWLGEKAISLRKEASEIYEQLTSLKTQKEHLEKDERERARLLDLYKFQAEEIEAAKLKPGEEEELLQERNRLANAEKLRISASDIYTALGGDEGAIDKLMMAATSAEKLAAIDASAEKFVENINAALISAQETFADIRDYIDEIEANPLRLEQIEERLDTIRLLKKKYGDTIDEVLKYGQELAEKIDSIINADDQLIELSRQIEKLTEQLNDICTQLTSIRKSAAGEFEKSIEKELAELAMDKTKFQLSITSCETGSKGADCIEFLISPNPGEPVKPLAKIASGGELSRIMLALKTVTASSDVPTLVFDEIDTGIGGVTAQVLGEKLASLAKKCQVLCVTHLPQVASRADIHCSVEKVVEGGRSFVKLNKLDEEGRVRELARMLGGKDINGAAAEHAKEMLSFAVTRNP